jgi:hypothetical protein
LRSDRFAQFPKCMQMAFFGLIPLHRFAIYQNGTVVPYHVQIDNIIKEMHDR